MTKAAAIALTMLCSGIIARQAPGQTLGQVQSPRSISSEIMLAEADTAAMAVLERYAAPGADASMPHTTPLASGLRAVTPDIESWHPSGHLLPLVLRRSIASDMPAAIRVAPPRLPDMKKLHWKPSENFSITISNGSAGNYMPWPNCPIGYLDARTLSFPLPR